MLTFVLLLALMVGGSEPDWYDHYQKGVHLIEQGRAADARPELEAALSARGREGLQLVTSAQRYIDYLPHLYLAIADQMTGDLKAARKQLLLAEDSGIATKSEVGRPLMVAYQLLLRGKDESLSRSYNDFSQKPVMSDEEFRTLRNDVLSSCNLAPDARAGETPWYANYELGLRLEQKGDYPRALTQFIGAVTNRPNPARRARMYGMWLIDYYPYFHIARSHVRLENWECAKNALDISQKLGEIPAGTPELNELLSLQRETAKNLAMK